MARMQVTEQMQSRIASIALRITKRNDGPAWRLSVAGNAIAFGRTPAEVISIVTLGGKDNKVSYELVRHVVRAAVGHGKASAGLQLIAMTWSKFPSYPCVFTQSATP